MLEAYLKEFSDEDAVELYILTKPFSDSGSGFKDKMTRWADALQAPPQPPPPPAPPPSEDALQQLKQQVQSQHAAAAAAAAVTGASGAALQTQGSVGSLGAAASRRLPLSLPHDHGALLALPLNSAACAADWLGISNCSLAASQSTASLSWQQQPQAAARSLLNEADADVAQGAQHSTATQLSQRARLRAAHAAAQARIFAAQLDAGMEATAAAAAAAAAAITTDDDIIDAGATASAIGGSSSSSSSRGGSSMSSFPQRRRLSGDNSTARSRPALFVVDAHISDGECKPSPVHLLYTQHHWPGLTLIHTNTHTHAQ